MEVYEIFQQHDRIVIIIELIEHGDLYAFIKQ